MDNNRLVIASYHGHNDSLIKAQAELASRIIIAYDTDEASILATMNTREYLESKKLSNAPEVIVRIYTLKILVKQNVQNYCSSCFSC